MPVQGLFVSLQFVEQDKLFRMLFEMNGHVSLVNLGRTIDSGSAHFALGSSFLPGVVIFGIEELPYWVHERHLQSCMVQEAWSFEIK